MADLTEDELHAMERAHRADEAERCALLAEELASIHEASARRRRKGGSYTVRALWPFGAQVVVVRPGAERDARVLDQAANSLRVIARGCREGWDTRKLQPHERGHGCAVGTGVDGDETLKNMRC